MYGVPPNLPAPLYQKVILPGFIPLSAISIAPDSKTGTYWNWVFNFSLNDNILCEAGASEANHQQSESGCPSDLNRGDRGDRIQLQVFNELTIRIFTTYYSIQ